MAAYAVAVTRTAPRTAAIPAHEDDDADLLDDSLADEAWEAEVQDRHALIAG